MKISKDEFDYLCACILLMRAEVFGSMKDVEEMVMRGSVFEEKDIPGNLIRKMIDNIISE